MWAFRTAVCALAITSMWGQERTSTATDADAARGRTLVEGRAGCLKCHRIHGRGSAYGPDLSAIGSARTAAQLEESILQPDAEIDPHNRPYRVVTRDGGTVNGRLLNEDTFTVQLVDTGGRLRSFDKSSLRSYAFVDKSPMPSFEGKLSARELADIVAYLESLKNPDSAQPAAAPR
ncbi:MAG TPA: c-type cytochrome [Bryobacteraceae bacterium]|nr:c-type cytochrome [Bryobacteraceae bacterium]